MNKLPLYISQIVNIPTKELLTMFILVEELSNKTNNEVLYDFIIWSHTIFKDLKKHLRTKIDQSTYLYEEILYNYTFDSWTELYERYKKSYAVFNKALDEFFYDYDFHESIKVLIIQHNNSHTPEEAIQILVESIEEILKNFNIVNEENLEESLSESSQTSSQD